MIKENSEIKRYFNDFRKNLKALKQANITPAQMANMMKAADVWFKITVNLREIEGSWAKAFKTYIRLFKGVPRKSIRQTNDGTSEHGTPDNFSE